MNDTHEEKIVAGNVTIHRTVGGTYWFLDKGGNKRTLPHDPSIHRLIEAIREGSGEPNVTTHHEGNQKLTNLGAGGNEWRTMGTGGNWVNLPESVLGSDE